MAIHGGKGPSYARRYLVDTPTEILHAEIGRLEKEIAAIRADAAASIYFWGQFASAYSKVHHELDADITRLRGPVPIDVVLVHPNAPVMPQGVEGGGRTEVLGRQDSGRPQSQKPHSLQRMAAPVRSEGQARDVPAR